MTKNIDILVIGGAGYLGSVLVPYLLKNQLKVTVFDNLIFGQSTLLDCCSYPNFKFIKGDICDFDLINKLLPNFDVVIPLAAIVGAPACAQNPTYARLVNFDAHNNILNHTSGEQIVLFPTTNSGYGVGEKDTYCTEESPLRPISDYGRMKVEIESKLIDKGNAVSFRLATLFGMSPRMRTDLLVNDFVFRALKDRVLVLFEENFRRNFIHVADVARTFLFGIENFEQMRGESFNIGLSSANLTKRSLAEKIREHLPDLYIHSANIGEDPDKRDYLVSNKKIEMLGWETEHSLDDGIQELIKGYQIIRPNLFANI